MKKRPRRYLPFDASEERLRLGGDGSVGEQAGLSMPLRSD